MAGIYIHIPFCKQTCHYCDFHFSTSLNRKEDFLLALEREIALQKDYLNGEKVNTIYFGGGTPSLLEGEEVERIMEQLHSFHSISENAEITLEANPDDLSADKIKVLGKTPVNRFSIGIQSFFDEDLQYMNRAHNADEAFNAIEKSKEYGFDNLTVDFIYGTPTMDNERWLKNLEKLVEYQIPHISAYALTVENYTPLEALIARNKRKAVSEEQSSEQFELLLDFAREQGYEQYEISNFAKNSLYSRHNSAYWLQEKYLGLGPSAHSYNGHNRQWNIPHNIKYIKGLEKGELNFQSEELSNTTRFNEYLLTGLRTKWGVNLDRIEEDFGKPYSAHLEKETSPALKEGLIKKKNNTFILTNRGKLLADAITAELFVNSPEI